jgi:Uma2 family endonuclease
MGMSAPASPYLTVEQVLAMPDDGQRHELVYGELLVSPAPNLRHQWIVGSLFALLREYCLRERIGRAFGAAADITWGREDTLVQPDVFVLGARDSHVNEWRDAHDILLVAEVLSPSTRHHDRYRKRIVYRDRGVPLYWIIDPEEGAAEVWTPEASFPVYEESTLLWNPEGASTPFRVTLEELRSS